MCHGWPGYCGTWRHQLRALATAGYRAVAPDMRGYGYTDAPEAVDTYSIHHLVGDIVDLVFTLGAQQAVVVGHDWGASVAWHAAFMRPDVFSAVAALSVPLRRRPAIPPLQALRQAQLGDYYWIYFQEPGIAEEEFERDTRSTLQRLMFSVRHAFHLRVPAGKGFLDGADKTPAMPAWMDGDDFDALVAEYQRTGFRGGLNWYRNLDRNWELTAPFANVTVRQPACFIAGTLDGVIRGPIGEAALAEMPALVPGLRQKMLIDGAGHWINEQCPTEVNGELVRFLNTVS